MGLQNHGTITVMVVLYQYDNIQNATEEIFECRVPQETVANLWIFSVDNSVLMLKLIYWNRSTFAVKKFINIRLQLIQMSLLLIFC